MHTYPGNSPFLMNKLILVSKLFDVKLLVWDKKVATESSVHFALANKSALNILRELIQALLTISLNPLQSLSLMRLFGLKKFIRGHYFIRNRFDVIHFEFATLAKEWIGVKKVVESKVVVSFRGYDLNYFEVDSQTTYNEVWNSADAFHFLGKDLFRRALKRNYNGEKPNYFISPAIDLNFFKGEGQKKYLTNGKLHIVSVGRVVWKKGYEYGLKALKILVDKKCNVHYTIVGGGDNMQAIKFCIHELGLADWVTLKDSASQFEVKNILSKSDLFLHPAVSEGYCNAVIEAQAMRLAVVCTKADGLQENIEEGVTGFAVDIYDANELADRMECLYNNPQLLVAFGNAGRKRVELLYRIESQMEKFERMYNEVSTHYIEN